MLKIILTASSLTILTGCTQAPSCDSQAVVESLSDYVTQLSNEHFESGSFADLDPEEQGVLYERSDGADSLSYVFTDSVERTSNTAICRATLAGERKIRFSKKILHFKINLRYAAQMNDGQAIIRIDEIDTFLEAFFDQRETPESLKYVDYFERQDLDRQRKENLDRQREEDLDRKRKQDEVKEQSEKIAAERDEINKIQSDPLSVIR